MKVQIDIPAHLLPFLDKQRDGLQIVRYMESLNTREQRPSIEDAVLFVLEVGRNRMEDQEAESFRLEGRAVSDDPQERGGPRSYELDENIPF